MNAFEISKILKEKLFRTVIEGEVYSSRLLQGLESAALKKPRQADSFIALCPCHGPLLKLSFRGWDHTGSNEVNLSFWSALRIGGKAGVDPWIFGLMNAAPYFAAALLGCWTSKPSNFRFGRRVTIFVAGIFRLFSVIGSGLSQTWEQLLVTRVLIGIGMDCKATTVPIFAAENSRASIRGACHELADVDCFWNLSRVLCQSGCLQLPAYLMAASARFRVYTGRAVGPRCLFLYG